MFGPDPRGICHWRATPPGFHHPSRPYPGPSCPGRRRLGVAISCESQPASPTATGKTAESHPGHPLAGPSAVVPTLSTPDRSRTTCQPGGRGHGPCAGGVYVGHGSTGCRDTVRPKDRARYNAQLRRFPECIGRDAAPVWGNPRRRYETPRTYSGLERGRHPTEARKVGANPRRAAGATVVSDWLRLFRCTQAK